MVLNFQADVLNRRVLICGCLLYMLCTVTLINLCVHLLYNSHFSILQGKQKLAREITRSLKTNIGSRNH